MLLPLLMNLGWAAGNVVTPLPPETSYVRDIRNGSSYGTIFIPKTNIKEEKNPKIEIEDSEIIAIIQVCLKTIPI